MSDTIDDTTVDLARMVSEALGHPVADDDNLIEQGLSSLQVMNLVGELRAAGHEATFGGFMSAPTIAQWRTAMASAPVRRIRRKRRVVIDQSEPFDLTEVQRAYWVGRRPGQYLGGVGCHGYLEVDGHGVDPERLARAWEELQEIHPMLRARFTEDGRQQIMETSGNDALLVHDLRGEDPRAVEARLLEMRQRLSHRLLDIGKGQVAGLQLSLLHGGATRIHFDIDLLICDVTSYQIILRDLAILYTGQGEVAAPRDWNVASCLAALRAAEEPHRAADEQYWAERIDDIPAPPQLPLAADPQTIHEPRFVRRSRQIDASLWQTFQRRAAAARVTAASALMVIYAKVIERWSGGDPMAMNIPLFNRAHAGQELADVVADFTSLVLVTMPTSTGMSFASEVTAAQSRLHEAMSHQAFSGLAVTREKLHACPGQRTVAPVVFSCNIGVELFSPLFRDSLGEMGFMISQTPQVWLDFQLFTVDGGLLLIWDAVEQIFSPDVLDDMFRGFVEAIELVCDDGFDWDQPLQIPLADALARRAGLAPAPLELSHDTIHGAFFENARRAPDATALVDGGTGESIGYAQLADQALRVAAHLVDNGVRPGDLVAVELSRGIPQVVGALGVLAAGAAYVPIRVDQPLARRERMYARGSVRHVLTEHPSADSGRVELSLDRALAAAPLAGPVPVSGGDVAYVIFTSGSTGEPKGVEMSHVAVQNTLEAVVAHNGIVDTDRVLMVSSFDFDLSVFDIFGMLGAGACAVAVPQESWRDAEAWIRMCREHRVTVWNSVPALLRMLLVSAAGAGQALEDLRIVLLSGDWIGLDLPDLLAGVAPGASITAMGGATEAAIWSNEFRVERPLPASWVSIPYGVPLPGQAYRVVDVAGRDCPDLVPGELWIGGVGVANGYRGDPEQSADRFVEADGQRWYRTGDYGRFWTDGILEFLGRRDHQVKVRGHRIELEEIESVLTGLPEVATSCVLAVPHGDSTQLAAWVVPSATPEPLFVRSSPAEPAAISVAGDHARLDEVAAYRLENIRAQRQALGRCLTRILDGLDAREVLASHQSLYRRWQEFIIDWYEEASTPQIAELERFLDPWVRDGAALLTGRLTAAEFVLRHPGARPERLAATQPFVAERNERMDQFLSEWLAARGVPSNVLVIGAREPGRVAALIESLVAMGEGTRMLVADERSTELETVDALAAGNPMVSTSAFHWDGLGQLGVDTQWDLVICLDSLHRGNDVDRCLNTIASMLAPGGWLLVAEATVNLPIQMLVVDLLDGGAAPTDRRAASGGRLMDTAEWSAAARDCGFEAISAFPPAETGQLLLAARRPPSTWSVDHARWESRLGELLPHYMVPPTVVVADALPVTGNGKLDRARMRRLSLAEAPAQAKEEDLPRGKVEQRLAEIWKKILGCAQVSRGDNFLSLGGDSLSATTMAVAVNKEFGVHITLDAVFATPELSGLAATVVADLDLGVADPQSDELPQAVPDPDHRFEPFPLTEIQQAYWLGRTGLYAFGGMSTHCYFEMAAPDLDLARAEDAWNRLIEAHDMLRVVLLPDGSGQRILPEVPRYEFLTAAGAGDPRAELRRIMSAEQTDLTNWPLFSIGVSGEGPDRVLHLSFDNTALDGFSIFSLFAQWKQSYVEPGGDLPTPQVTFRDYVLALQQTGTTPAYERDLDYWMQRVAALPAAPALPVATGHTSSAFRRLETRLGAETWSSLRARAAERGVSPSAVLMSAYAEVLARWSESKQFTLNLTRFNKLPLHPDVDALIGDFTSLTLLGLDWSAPTFAERCNHLQARLWADLAHPLVSGVSVLREWTRAHGDAGNQPGMPVVFTSGLGINRAGRSEDNYFGPILRGNSQTPQVWLDQQVSEQDGDLLLSWDIAEEVLVPEVVDVMFGQLVGLLTTLATEDAVFDEPTTSLIPYHGSVERAEANRTDAELPAQDMLSPLWSWAADRPEAPLVIGGERTLSYSQADELSEGLRRALETQGTGPGDIVAVTVPKGWRQVVAVIGVMKTGAAYLPLDPRGPAERMRRIMERSGARCVVLCDEVADTVEAWGQPVVNLDEVTPVAPAPESRIAPDPDSRAYVIFTSGSTGEPKGVAMTHDAVVNTIDAVNRQQGLGPGDRTIMLSNLTFDLSVFDIFGMLRCGGAVVVPGEADHRNPAAWAELIDRHQVTVWNSVPMFMSMMVLHLSSHPQRFPSLRRVLLSGDWIPLDLPGDILRHFPAAWVTSLGGATEAAIWSNSFRVHDIDPAWNSIPYGKPLPNQRFRILDELGDDVPDGVAGDLHIAGRGLALGYLNAPEETARAFFVHPRTGERLYRTGDRARYLPDGNVEFLGRADNQVKVGGHRIELGEIESALAGLGQVSAAAVSAAGDRESRRLVAHVVLADDPAVEADLSVLSRIAAADPAETGLVRGLDTMAVGVIEGDWRELLGGVDPRSLDVRDAIARAGIAPAMVHLAENQLAALDDDRPGQGDPAVAGALRARLEHDRPIRLGLLRGTLSVSEVLLDDTSVLTPADLVGYQPAGFRHSQELVTRTVAALVDQGLGEGPVMVLNGRLGTSPAEIAAQLGSGGRLVLVDPSASVAAELRRRAPESAEVAVWDWSNDDPPTGLVLSKIVVADNSLHRSPDIGAALCHVRDAMDTGGRLVIREQTHNSPLMLVTTALFEGGYASIVDARGTPPSAARGTAVDRRTDPGGVRGHQLLRHRPPGGGRPRRSPRRQGHQGRPGGHRRGSRGEAALLHDPRRSPRPRVPAADRQRQAEPQAAGGDGGAGLQRTRPSGGGAHRDRADDRPRLGRDPGTQ